MHLLPSRLLLRQRPECLVQRIGDDGTHSLIPRPRRVHPRLSQQMHKCFFAFLESLEAVVGDDRIVRQVRPGRKDGGRREWQATGVHPDREIHAVRCGACIGVAEGQ